MKAALRYIIKSNMVVMFLATLLTCPVSMDAKLPSHPLDGLTAAEHLTTRAWGLSCPR